MDAATRSPVETSFEGPEGIATALEMVRNQLAGSRAEVAELYRELTLHRVTEEATEPVREARQNLDWAIANLDRAVRRARAAALAAQTDEA